MKFFKSSIMAILGMAVALTSCSEDKYEPATNSPGAFFAQGQETVIYISDTETSFSVPVLRTQDAAASYTVTSTDVSGLFSIPGNISFSGDQTISELVISYDPAKLEEAVPYEISLTIESKSDYGRSTINLSVSMQQPMVSEPWVEGYGTYTYSNYFQGDDPDLPISVSYMPSDPNKVTWTIEHWAYDVDLQITCDDISYLDSYGTNVIMVPIQATGAVNDSYGDMYISDFYHFFLENMGNPAGAENYADASYYDPNTGTFYLYTLYFGSGQEPGYYVGNYGYETFQVEGFPDNSITVTYDGMFTDRYQDKVAQATIQCGVDVSAVKAIMVEGSDPNDGINDILNDAAGVQEYEPAEVIKAEFEVTTGGTFTIVAVAYDSKGEAATYDYDTFDIELGGAADDGDWQDIGYADFADGWCIAAYSIGDEGLEPLDWAYSVLVQRYVGDDAFEGEMLFRMVNAYGNNPLTEQGFNAYRAKRNIQFGVSGTFGYMLPQLCGYGAANWGGEMTIGTIEGLYMDEYGLDLESVTTVLTQNGFGPQLTHYEDDIFEVPMPIWAIPLYDNEFGYNWKEYKASYIFLPEVEANVRAKVRARSMATPNLTGVNVQTRGNKTVKTLNAKEAKQARHNAFNQKAHKLDVKAAKAPRLRR